MNNLKALIVAIAVANSHAFLGNKLPDVIDLYANFLEIFDGAKHFPSKKELGLVEAYNLNLGFVKMSPVTCGYNSAYGAADPCYYAISMGNVSHVENFRDSFDLPEMMQFIHTVFRIEAAKQLVEEGVDFVAIATSSPSCSAGFTPEYVFKIKLFVITGMS
ncbi:hypothetical protein L0F63_001421 [Massospora cicadina]|nr:hypothetical protein L0F63_001421 [Massospora cicadina]